MMRRSHLAGPGSMREVFIFHSSCIYSKPFLPAVSDLRHHSSMGEIEMFRQLTANQCSRSRRFGRRDIPMHEVSMDLPFSG
jgi:hypothetical protein